LIESRQRLEAQHNENTSVSREFKKLSPNDKVYKLVGPGLLIQDQAEARTNVDKRLEFISTDL
jgi:prefoldin beta subunit